MNFVRAGYIGVLAFLLVIFILDSQGAFSASLDEAHSTDSQTAGIPQ